MRNFERVATPITGDDDGVAQNQTLGGSGNLNLNGAGLKADDGTAAYDIGAVVLNPPRRVTLTSAANLSARTLTIYGTDRAGNPLVETIAGPNATTVTTNYAYKTITRIASDGAIGSNIKIGWGTEFISSWVFLGNQRQDGRLRVRVFRPAGATVSYAIEATSKNLLRDRSVGDYADDIETVAEGKIDSDSFEFDAKSAPLAIRLKVASADQNVTMRVQPSVTV